MNDQFRTDRFSAFHDGEMPPVERDALRAELDASDTVRRELADYEQISQLLAELPVDRLGEDFRAEVMQTAERRMLLPLAAELATRRRRGLGRRWWPGVVALATSAAILLLMLRLLDDRSAPELENVARRTADEAAGTTAATSDRVSEVATAVVDGPAAVPESKDAADFTVAGEAVDETSGIATRGAKGAALPSVSNQAAIAYDLEAAGPASRLEFNENLEQAQVGEVVNALDRSGDRISVVRLTVVDRMQGLEHLQLLLTKNDIPISPAADEEKVVEAKQLELLELAKVGKKSLSKADAVARDEQSADKNDALGDASDKKADDELVCVLVKADGAQLSAALWQLRQEGQFQDLRVEDPPIEIAQLDAYLPELARAAVDDFADPVEAQKPGEPAKRELQGKRGRALQSPKASQHVAKGGSRKTPESAAQEAPSDEPAALAESTSRAFSDLPQQQMRVQLPSRLLEKPSQVGGNRGQVEGQQESLALRNNKSQAAPQKQADNGRGERQRAFVAQKGANASAPSGPVQVLLVLVEGQSPPAAGAPASPAKPAE
ncbi:MAG: hypothetical protein WD648_14555 [Planctomycetaceae bacterium]